MTKSKKPKVSSSKEPVPLLRNIIPVSSSKKKQRDPRFDSVSGTLNKDLFKKSYHWIDDLYSKEKQFLKSQLIAEKNPQLKEQLKKQFVSMEAREKQNKKNEEEERLFREVKKQEEDLVKQGKRPFYLKKSEKQNLLLVDKYKKAVASGANMEDILEKRRKHTASRQHKRLPFRRDRSSVVDK